MKGEATPIDIADEYYGTQFGDLVGWMSGGQVDQRALQLGVRRVVPLTW